MSNWVIMVIVGVLSLLAGIFALMNPFAASITATLLAGWSFVILGVLQVWAGLRAEGTSSKILGALLGLVALVIGVNLVGEPLQGLVALTFIAGISFLVSGIFKAWIGFAHAEGPFRMALLFSGIISIVLGAMVLSNFPQSATVVLGILLSVELISNGVSAIAMGMSTRNA